MNIISSGLWAKCFGILAVGIWGWRQGADDACKPRGAAWFILCPDVCVQKGRTWLLFQLQGSEMSENISLKMGVKFAASLNIIKNLF